MAGVLKRMLWHTAKALGLFRLSRRITRNGLRILCYHGFSEGDEHVFRPLTFMRSETFCRRLSHLARHRYPVLALGEAIRRLHDGTLPAGATAITIDDGFSSSYRQTIPALADFGFPATMYVTTYYCVKRNPIFRLAIQYMFWKTAAQELDLLGLGDLAGRVSLANQPEKDHVVHEIICYGESSCDEPGRERLAQQIGERLDVDYGAIVRQRSLDLMSQEEVRSAADVGLDIQLHTHRHRLPPDEQQTQREIVECRSVLEPLVKSPLIHFCYPSGVWSECHTPWLAALGIETATTCDMGLNYRHTPKLALCRFLDSEDIPEIEFEAEMCGFKEILRKARAGFRRLRR